MDAWRRVFVGKRMGGGRGMDDKYNKGGMFMSSLCPFLA